MNNEKKNNSRIITRETDGDMKHYEKMTVEQYQSCNCKSPFFLEEAGLGRKYFSIISSYINQFGQFSELYAYNIIYVEI